MAPNLARYRQAEQRLWASVGVSPRDRQLYLRRTRVEIRIQEVGEGPAVVFVHGGSINGTSWATLVAKLPDFRCILVDRPGCGLSAPLVSGFSDVQRCNAFAEAFVVDVLDELELSSAFLVGTSFGGYTTIRAAAAHPDRIDRLVEFGYPVGAPTGAVPFVMRLGVVPGVSRLGTLIRPNQRMVNALYRQIGLGQALDNGRISEELNGWFISLLGDTATMANEVNAGPRWLTPIKGMNESLLLSSEVLGRVSMSTYFLWGECDVFGGDEIARSFVRHFPNAVLEMMPDAGHAVWMDNPDHAAATLRNFFAEPRN